MASRVDTDNKGQDKAGCLCYECICTNYPNMFIIAKGNILDGVEAVE